MQHLTGVVYFKPVMIKTKIRKVCTGQRVFAVMALSLLMLVSARFPLLAQAVTQGYGSEQTLQRGMVVQLKASDTTKVEAVTQKTQDKSHGVVVDSNDAPVTLSSEGKKVFVATAGHYETLVSTQNGPIKAGDFIAVSAIDGIGMKASQQELYVIGRALGDFDGKANAISTTTIKDSGGASKSINIGRVDVDITVAKNPNLKGREANLPAVLQRVSEAIAGKPVNTARVYVGLFVFILSTFVAGVLMLGGIRSGIISIGRNPLGKKAIIRGMLQVILTGITIFITGIFGVYLLLKI